jgi:hypothetical protein
MDCGDPAALSVIVSAALRVPAAVGLNVTEMAHFALAAADVPQVFVCAKSLASAPVIAMPVMLNAAVPLFVRVTDWALLAVAMFSLVKVSAEALKDTAGLAAVTVIVAPVVQ